MFLTKKAIPRRTFLKSAQAALALPLLDAMIPAATAWAETPAKPVPRLGFVFIPMGCDQARWTPPGQGRLDELSPILAPLKPVKDQVTVITNTRLQNAYPGTHDTSNSAFLSAASSKHTESSDYFLGTTVDQIAAKQMGRETQLASLQLAMDLNPLAGVCNNGYACVYQNCLSWSSPTTPLPAEAHPRIVFERLFGEGGNAAARKVALSDRASLLDSFNGDIVKLMFDLQILAFQADITRVVTFQLTREQSNRTYPEVGVADPHHPTSHHGNDPEKLAKIAKINAFHISLFSDFLQKMAATLDGNGSLLDHSVYLYGSGMGNPSVHDHENLPILVAGG